MPFTAQTRMSGVDLTRRRTEPALQVRKGAASAVMAVGPRQRRAPAPARSAPIVDGISAAGGTPLVVAEQRRRRPARVLGVIHLKDVVKAGMRERFDEMRRMGIRTVMITGDNPLTARAIADEAGVDDFLAEATPEDKMALIKKEQEGGKLVAMTGDGTNDAPALAQADVGVAMNTGTSAAKEAGNMVDLDSDPTKLIEIVEIGKQLLITRGALTTFSIANDIAKYFAIIPAMFAAVYPGLDTLNIMRLHSPTSAILVGGHLQRADHRRADPAGPARRAVPPGSAGGDAAPQPARLRARAASSRRSSASRSSTCSSSSSPGSRDAPAQLARPAPRRPARPARPHRRLSASPTRSRSWRSPRSRASSGRADGSLVTAGGTHGRQLADRPVVHRRRRATRSRSTSSRRPSAAGRRLRPDGDRRSNLGPESVVDTLPNPTVSGDTGKQSLLTQVCARSDAVGELEGVDGRRPYCTPDGVGAVLAVFHRERRSPARSPGWSASTRPARPPRSSPPTRACAWSAPDSARTTRRADRHPGPRRCARHCRRSRRTRSPPAAAASTRRSAPPTPGSRRRGSRGPAAMTPAEVLRP